MGNLDRNGGINMSVEVSINLPCSTGKVFLNLGHISALVLGHDRKTLYAHMLSGTIFTINGTQSQRDLLFTQWNQYNGVDE